MRLLAESERHAMQDLAKAPLIPCGEGWAGDAYHQGDILRELCRFGLVQRALLTGTCRDPVELTEKGIEWCKANL